MDVFIPKFSSNIRRKDSRFGFIRYKLKEEIWNAIQYKNGRKINVKSILAKEAVYGKNMNSVSIQRNDVSTLKSEKTNNSTRNFVSFKDVLVNGESSNPKVPMNGAMRLFLIQKLKFAQSLQKDVMFL